jgi:nuclear cap-binding protein subunit 2
VRDEHRDDYDPGRGGWGAQAQRLEMERRREEVEERYADNTGLVAGGGGDWKAGEKAATLKRGRSPDDEGEGNQVCFCLDVSRLLI